MKLPETLDSLVTRAKIQMIGVSQNDLRVHPSELLRGDALHGSQCPDGHENRGKYLVRLSRGALQGHLAGTGARYPLLVFERVLNFKLQDVWSKRHGERG